MKHKPLPTQDRLQQLFNYQNGLLVWKNPTNNRVKEGDVAGTERVDGYRHTYVDGVPYLNHRLIWMLHTGEDPGELVIDHIDQDKSNNRFQNLRLASTSLNAHNSSKPRGCSYNKRREMWEANIMNNYRSKFLGYFSTKEEARQAYLHAKRLAVALIEDLEEATV